MAAGIHPGFIIGQVDRIHREPSPNETENQIQKIWNSFLTGLLYGTVGATILFLALKLKSIVNLTNVVIGAQIGTAFGLGGVAVGIIAAIAISKFFEERRT